MRIEAHEIVIIYHVRKWDGFNMEKSFRNWEARDSNEVSKAGFLKPSCKSKKKMVLRNLGAGQE